LAEQIDGEGSERGTDTSGGGLANTASILVVGEVPAVVDAHFDRPVTPAEGDEVSGGASLRVSAAEQIEPAFFESAAFRVKPRAV
jgi:hypothetical protein